MNKSPIYDRGYIPDRYKETPIEQLWKYHNGQACSETEYKKAELLVGMCMDHRNSLNIPDNFAYIIRTGGSNLRFSNFHVSFAIAIGEVKHIAVIGHTECGMVDLKSRKSAFIQGMKKRAGWTAARSRWHFQGSYNRFEIRSEVDFTRSETRRLRKKYPKIVVAPMLYQVHDRSLCFLRD